MPILGEIGVLETFELFLKMPDDAEEFEALTCRREDLVASVAEAIERVGAVSCRICKAGRPLYTLLRPFRT